MSDRGLSVLIYGQAGSGKSTAAATAPKPILDMDVENSSRFLDVRKVYWNPMEEAPPEYDGTWDMCVVPTDNWQVAQKAYDYLRSGQHPFKSVMVDSISEIQVKAMESVNGRNKMQTQHWGELLQKLGGLLRDLRDLVRANRSGIEMVILIATAREIEDPNSSGGSIWKPYLQGSIAQQVAYFFDITGYLYTVQEADADGVVVDRRYLFTGKHPNYEAKNRVKNFPPTIADPNFSEIMDNVFPTSPATATVENVSAQPEPVAVQPEPMLQVVEESAIVEPVVEASVPTNGNSVEAPTLDLDD